MFQSVQNVKAKKYEQESELANYGVEDVVISEKGKNFSRYNIRNKGGKIMDKFKYLLVTLYIDKEEVYAIYINGEKVNNKTKQYRLINILKNDIKGVK